MSRKTSLLLLQSVRAFISPLHLGGACGSYSKAFNSHLPLFPILRRRPHSVGEEAFPNPREKGIPRNAAEKRVTVSTRGGESNLSLRDMMMLMMTFAYDVLAANGRRKGRPWIRPAVLVVLAVSRPAS